MAGFSKNVGYHIESTPKLDANGNPMRTATGRVKTVETVTGREGDAEQQGVRLLITRARKTQHVRKSDGATMNDYYLTIVKANDCTSEKFSNQWSARPELKNDAIIVRNGNRLDVRYQHEFQFSCPEGTSNSKLDNILQHAIGPDGQAVTIDGLVDGKVTCAAFNAHVRPYKLSDADWQKRITDAGKMYPNMTTPKMEDRTAFTSFAIADEVFSPTIAPNLDKHNRNTKKAAENVNNFSKYKESQEAAVNDMSEAADDSFEEEEDFDI
jgi:hypothetical protein